MSGLDTQVTSGVDLFFGLIVKLMTNFRFVKIFTKLTSLTCNKVDDEIPVRRICVNPIMLIKNKLLSNL